MSETRGPRTLVTRLGLTIRCVLPAFSARAERQRRGELVFPEDWHDRVAGGLRGLAGAAAGDRLGGAGAERVGSPGQGGCSTRRPRRLTTYRYANRVAISNSRLLGIEGKEVLFRYKDYRDGDQWKTMRMPGVEFIRRFLLHVLPKGMRHIRRLASWVPGCIPKA